ncbi:MAG TPA: hypothetical protein VMF53_01095 [Alphaproteobacteria bacterium]|nr:hypothetical protein [Alphaproteobacteria bacterium]
MKAAPHRSAGKSRESKNPMTFARAREILAWTWSLSLLLVLIVLVQTAMGYYKTDWQIPWGWLSPLLFPILSMVFGAITARTSLAHETEVRSKQLFVITLILSALYIVALYIVVIFGAISPNGIEWLMAASTWFLIPFQVIVSISLSKFFVEELR